MFFRLRLSFETLIWKLIRFHILWNNKRARIDDISENFKVLWIARNPSKSFPISFVRRLHPSRKTRENFTSFGALSVFASFSHRDFRSKRNFKEKNPFDQATASRADYLSLEVSHRPERFYWQKRRFRKNKTGRKTSPQNQHVHFFFPALGHS